MSVCCFNPQMPTMVIAGSGRNPKQELNSRTFGWQESNYICHYHCFPGSVLVRNWNWEAVSSIKLTHSEPGWVILTTDLIPSLNYILYVVCFPIYILSYWSEFQRVTVF